MVAQKIPQLSVPKFHIKCQPVGKMSECLCYHSQPEWPCNCVTLVQCVQPWHELKVKGHDIYIPPLTAKPKEQRFTIKSGVLTSTSSRLRGYPLPEWTDFGPHSLQLDRPTYAPASQPHYGLHPAMFSGNDSLFLVASIYQTVTATHLPTPEEWKAELAWAPWV